MIAQQEARVTKARTVGQKRRKGGRPRKEGPRSPGGRPSRAGEREAIKRANIVARCKAMGWLPRTDDQGNLSWMPTADMAKRAIEPHMGCTAGRAIDGHKDQAKLWEGVKRIRVVYERYWRSIGAPSPYPKAANIELLPEPLSTEGNEIVRFDDRPESDRVRAAANAMMGVEQALGMAGYGVRAECLSVVLWGAEVAYPERLFLGLAAVVE